MWNVGLASQVRASVNRPTDETTETAMSLIMRGIRLIGADIIFRWRMPSPGR
jgi:hypothetical protein